MLGAETMTIPDYIDRFVEFALFLANLLVCSLAVTTYQATRKRCLLFIAISAGIATLLAVVPWIREDKPSWTFWGFYTAASLCDLTLWVVGVRILFRDYANLLAPLAQPSAAPNGGPTTPVDNSRVTEGPPSVS
jgi:hypothetical protein